MPGIKHDMAASIAVAEKINALGSKMPELLRQQQLEINRQMNNPPRRNPLDQLKRYKG